MRYLTGTTMYKILYSHGACNVIGFMNLDHGGDLDQERFTTGYVFTLGGGTIIWRLMLQPITAFVYNKNIIYENH